MTFAYGGGVTMYGGHGSVATPGALPACQQAIEQRGLAGWADVVAPSAAACRAGYPIGDAAATYLGTPPNPLRRPRPGGARDRHAPRRHALQAGDISTNHPLAEVLDLVARDGSSVMTIGEVGRPWSPTWPPHDGLITARDLAEYDPAVRVPVRRRIGDWSSRSTCPPVSADRCLPSCSARWPSAPRRARAA